MSILLNNKYRDNSGFTLVELVVVATIIAVISVFGMVSYRAASAKSRDAKRRADMETVRQALVLFRSEESRYPAGNFPTMVAELLAADYLSDGIDRFTDPQSGHTAYSYTPTPSGCTTLCTGFTVTAILDDSTAYSLTNP